MLHRFLFILLSTTLFFGASASAFAEVPPVVPVPLTVTADSKTKIYGATDPIFTASYSGFVNSDDETSLTTPISFTRDPAGEDAGVYAIIPSAAASANYIITFVPGTLEIMPAPLSNSITLTTSGDESGKSGVIFTDTEASTTSGGIITTLTIPASTVIRGPSVWDGTVTFPIATTTYTLIADSGNTASAVLAIEVGAGNIRLTFDQAAELTFAGQAGKLIGWSQAGVFHQITNTCDSPTAPTLVAGADCKINVGSDLIVWTKHFSTFIAYTQTAIPAIVSSGGGGNGAPVGGGGSVIPTFGLPNTTNAPAGNTGGEVLGASAYHFTLSLGLGSTGGDVTALQQTLIDKGFLKIAAPTSYFGGLTQAALKQYQAKYAIAQVGLVGPQTRAQLNKGSTPASGAHSVTQAQADALLGLLQSFGADASIIANVKASLGY